MLCLAGGAPLLLSSFLSPGWLFGFCGCLLASIFALKIAHRFYSGNLKQDLVIVSVCAICFVVCYRFVREIMLGAYNQNPEVFSGITFIFLPACLLISLPRIDSLLQEVITARHSAKRK